MTYTSKAIEDDVRVHFAQKYKAFGNFIDSGSLWDDCISAVHDVKLMNNIIFCNDIHEIPPVHTFLKVRQQAVDLSELEKRSVGAFWGYVFKFVFKYRNQKSVTARVNSVRTATYFYDVQEPVQVV